jgi:replicative DNA helicase
MPAVAEYEEVAVLGACIQDDACWQEVYGYLNERDFFKEEHRLMWRAMCELSQEGTNVDIISVIGKLRAKKCLTRAGGASGVSTLSDFTPDVNNAMQYAKEVKRASTSRDLVRVGNGLRNEEVDPTRRMEIALGLLSDISNQSIMTREVLIGDVAEEIVARVVRREDELDGIKMGFPELDEAFGGLGAGSFYILAARPSLGKSAFTLQVAANVAKQGNPVLYVSPEMTEDQLARRLLSSESGVSYKKIPKPSTMSQSEVRAIEEAHEKIRLMPLVLDDTSKTTLADVRFKAQRMKSKGGLDLLIVDYLQLLCEGDDSKEAVTIVSKGLKALAKDLEIPVWAVSQMSRSSEYRDSKRPTLTDLRGSGHLEQDADAVSFLWFPTKAKDRIEVFIEKHRNGPLATTNLVLNKHTTRFQPGGW